MGLVVYPPTGSTAYGREMSTPPTLLRSMAHLLHQGMQTSKGAAVVGTYDKIFSFTIFTDISLIFIHAALLGFAANTQVM